MYVILLIEKDLTSFFSCFSISQRTFVSSTGRKRKFCCKSVYFKKSKIPKHFTHEMLDLMSPNMTNIHTHTHLRQPENILIVYTDLSRQFVTHTLKIQFFCHTILHFHMPYILYKIHFHRLLYSRIYDYEIKKTRSITCAKMKIYRNILVHCYCYTRFKLVFVLFLYDGKCKRVILPRTLAIQPSVIGYMMYVSYISLLFVLMVKSRRDVLKQKNGLILQHEAHILLNSGLQSLISLIKCRCFKIFSLILNTTNVKN